jgi:hypothetical protein
MFCFFFVFMPVCSSVFDVWVTNEPTSGLFMFTQFDYSASMTETLKISYVRVDVRLEPRCAGNVCLSPGDHIVIINGWGQSTHQQYFIHRWVNKQYRSNLIRGGCGLQCYCRLPILIAWSQESLTSDEQPHEAINVFFNMRRLQGRTVICQRGRMKKPWRNHDKHRHDNHRHDNHRHDNHRHDNQADIFIIAGPVVCSSIHFLIHAYCLANPRPWVIDAKSITFFTGWSITNRWL